VIGSGRLKLALFLSKKVLISASDTEIFDVISLLTSLSIVIPCVARPGFHPPLFSVL